ncbi:hypothetical protein Tco_0793674 [Tanacetum coccineum]
MVECRVCPWVSKLVVWLIFRKCSMRDDAVFIRFKNQYVQKQNHGIEVDNGHELKFNQEGHYVRIRRRLSRWKMKLLSIVREANVNQIGTMALIAYFFTCQMFKVSLQCHSNSGNLFEVNSSYGHESSGKKLRGLNVDGFALKDNGVPRSLRFGLVLSRIYTEPWERIDEIIGNLGMAFDFYSGMKGWSVMSPGFMVLDIETFSGGYTVLPSRKT